MDVSNRITFREEISVLKAMVKKEFKIIMRYPLDFTLGFVQLIFWMLIFIFAALPFSSGGFESLGNGRFGNAILWGSIMFFILSDMIWIVGNGIRYAQRTGTLEQNILAPIREWYIAIARALRGLISDAPFLLWTIFVVYLITGYFVVENLALSLYVFSLSILTFIGFGLFYAGITVWIKRAEVLSNVIQFTLMFFCAMFFPFGSLPTEILTISKLIPFSYNVDLFRSLIGGLPPELITESITFLGVTLSPVMIELLIVHISTIFFLVAGFKIFNYSMKKAKLEGTLSHF
ncbi:MAG: ABC transporter permease [Candidatus Asgardarchaeia archaeon]